MNMIIAQPEKDIAIINYITAEEVTSPAMSNSMT